MYGFMHISRGQVEYRVTIRDIIPFSPAHYEDEALAGQVKPEPWLREWKENIDETRSHAWKNALVMTEIVPFSYDMYSFKKHNGTKVQRPPESYVRVLPPEHMPSLVTPPVLTEKGRPVVLLHERNLEDFVVQQLEVIEPGDVTGDFCTRWNERESTWRKSWSCRSRGTKQSRS
jgi:hypothetical protein